MNNNNRPDLSERNILLLLAVVIAAAASILLQPGGVPPGSVTGQLCAAAGALLFLAPLLFVVMKRSGLATSPPAWFITHVLATLFGCCLIFIHVATGEWLAPAGLVFVLLVALFVLVSLLLVAYSRGFSLLFARSGLPTGFSAPQALDKASLQRVIDDKVRLLQTLDPGADEALFSPALKHWLQHPFKSLRYQRLAEREAGMIGARSSAGRELSWPRRLHMLIAFGFYLGLLAHVIVVLFFAGYAAGGEAIDWWYITAWGG